MTVVETKRLVLKPLSMLDIDNLFALRSDPEVMKYVGDGRTQTKKEVREFITAGIGYFDKYGMDFFSVFEKETDSFVGQAGLFHLGFDLKQSNIELAYRLHKKYWGLGYATELACALIDYGFKQLSLPKIMVMHHPDNSASKRVIEKAGFHYSRMINHHGSRLPCYEIYNPRFSS